MNVIGLEVSTSAAKCINRKEEVVAEAVVDFKQDISDTVSQDPVGIYNAALQALVEVFKKTDQFNIAHCYRILTKEGGIPEEIRISGGIVKSPLWLQMAADIFEDEMVVSGFANASIIGAALFALRALGDVDSLKDYSGPVRNQIMPNPDRTTVYRRRFQQYLQFYESGEGIFDLQKTP